MDKREKEIAAMYLSGCLFDMKTASDNNDMDALEKFEQEYSDYKQSIRKILIMKFDMFGLDYHKYVEKPLQDIYKITGVFYAQRVRGEQMKYPA